jgi:hypothetical protein
MTNMIEKMVVLIWDHPFLPNIFIAMKQTESFPCYCIIIEGEIAMPMPD